MPKLGEKLILKPREIAVELEGEEVEEEDEVQFIPEQDPLAITNEESTPNVQIRNLLCPSSGCRKHFTVASSLYLHVHSAHEEPFLPATDGKEGVYECPLCDRQFALLEGLAAHTWDQHAPVMEEVEEEGETEEEQKKLKESQKIAAALSSNNHTVQYL